MLGVGEWDRVRSEIVGQEENGWERHYRGLTWIAAQISPLSTINMLWLMQVVVQVAGGEGARWLCDSKPPCTPGWWLQIGRIMWLQLAAG